MNALIIDTSTAPIMLMLIKDDKYITKIGQRTNKIGLEIMPLIDIILNENSLNIGQIDCFGIINGPGSFTGIRVGVSTVNALKFALNARLIEINALEYLLFGKDNGISALPTGKGDFFVLVKDGQDLNYYIMTKDELNQQESQLVYAVNDNFKQIFDCFKYKFNNKIFVNYSTPMYIKGTYAD